MTKALTRQAISAKNRSGRGIVSGKLAVAIEQMVWQGASRPEAANLAGMADHSLRAALKKPHVKRFYLNEIEVLRTSGRARRILRLEELSEQNDNRNAAVLALKAIEEMENLAPGGGAAKEPGLIFIITAAGADPVTIDPHRDDCEYD